MKTSNSRGVFLADLEFKESQAIFHRLGVKSLPWIVHLSHNVQVGLDGVIKFKHSDVVRQTSSMLQDIAVSKKTCLYVSVQYN